MLRKIGKVWSGLWSPNLGRSQAPGIKARRAETLLAGQLHNPSTGLRSREPGAASAAGAQQQIKNLQQPHQVIIQNLRESHNVMVTVGVRHLRQRQNFRCWG